MKLLRYVILIVLAMPYTTHHLHAMEQTTHENPAFKLFLQCHKEYIDLHYQVIIAEKSIDNEKDLKNKFGTLLKNVASLQVLLGCRLNSQKYSEDDKITNTLTHYLSKKIELLFNKPTQHKIPTDLNFSGRPSLWETGKAPKHKN